MNVSMNKKPPKRLEDMAAAMGRNVQKPYRLQQRIGNAVRQPNQAAPVRAAGQGAAAPFTGIQSRQPVPSPLPVQSRGRQAPLPVQGGGHQAPLPVQSRGCQAPLPVQGGGRQAPLPRTAASAQPIPKRKALTGMRLQKGQKVALAEHGCPLSQVEISIGWNAKNPACDLDASAFLLSGANKVVGDEWFVFYGQERSPDGSVAHHGDNADRMGESLTVNWRGMDPRVKKIVFTITINEALERGLDFGMVSDAYIQLRSPASGQGILYFELEEYYSNVTSMMAGELYERNGEWKFHAIGNGVARDLAGLCELYGVNVSG